MLSTKNSKLVNTKNVKKKVHIKWEKLIITIMAAFIIIFSITVILNSSFSTIAIANMETQNESLDKTKEEYSVDKNHTDKQYDYEKITVASGQTLWELAEIYSPENEDPRNFIHEIRKQNDLERAQIYAGEQIRIPR